jgi:hypothetical protein
MEWSIYPPDKPGFYWCKSLLYNYHVELFEVHNDVLYGHFIKEHPTLHGFKRAPLIIALLSHCKWYGPIEPPEDNG